MADQRAANADTDILSSISDLVERERVLREALSGGNADAEVEGGEAGARSELASLEVRLDQCWDLLRQRRARKEFGDNPDAARVRPASEVENYQN